MDTNYMLACEFAWRNNADPDAGWELVQALASPDPRLRVLAQHLLVENGQRSMALLESAVESGFVSPKLAGPCMAHILQNNRIKRRADQNVVVSDLAKQR
jgi:hypothetical protein